MGIIKRITDFINYKDGLEGDQKSNPYTHPGFDDNYYSFNSNDRYRNDREQAKSYNQLPWVSIAVDAMMEAAGGQPGQIVDTASGEPVPENRIPEEILIPIQNGDGVSSFAELLEGAVGQMLLAGNAVFWRTAGTAYGVSNRIKDHLKLFLPGEISPKISLSGLMLEGYEVDLKNGRSDTLQAEDVLHFSQNRGVLTRFWGVGNIEKIRLQAVSDLHAEQFQSNFMGNRAAPSMAILDHSERTADEIERIQMMVNKSYGRNKNAGKIMYLSGEKIDAKVLSISHKDMQFLEQKNYSRETTLGIFKVPPEAVGITQDSNRATSSEQMRRFYKNVNKVISKLEMTINKQFVHTIDPRFSYKIQRHLVSDIELVREMLQNGIITPNAAAQMMGQPVDEKDAARNAYYMPVNFVPIQYTDPVAVANETNKPEKAVKSHTCNHDKRLHDPHNYDLIADEFLKSATKPKKFQAKYIRAANKTKSEVEDKYTPEFAKFFKSQIKRIEANIKRNIDKIGPILQTKDLDDLKETPEQITGLIFSVDEENDELRKEAVRIHTSGVQRSIMDINVLTASQINPSVNNIFVKNAIDRLGKLITAGGPTAGAIGFRQGINETTRKQVELIVIDAVKNNLSVSELTTNLQNKFDQFQGYRARMIARTEASNAYHAGAEVSYREIGVKEIDIVGCTMFEPDSDCGKQNVPVAQMSALSFHPNHLGTAAPSEEP